MEENQNQPVSPPTAPSPPAQPADSPPPAPLPEKDQSARQPSAKAKKLGLIGLVVVIIIGLIVVLAWSKKTKKPEQTAMSKVSVRLEWLNGPEFTGMYIAQDKGFYKAENLNVDIREFTDATDVNKEVASGQENFGVSTPLELILARDKGEKNKAIAAVMQTSPYAFAARKDANIKSPADFKGKVLGNIGNNNEATVTYGVLLANAGLKASDATVKTVDYDVVKVFQDNQADTADIYRTDQTFLLDQAKVPYDLVYPEQFGFSIYGDVLIASDNQIAQHRAQTAGFVKATMKGWQYALDHQVEALTILAKHENKFYKVPGYAKFSLSATAPLIKATGNQPLGDMQYVTWNRAYNGVKEAGLLQTDFEASDTYTSQFVE